MASYLYEDDKYILFQKTKESLPIDGWLHECIFCGEITGRTIPFNHKIIDVELICCKLCTKKADVTSKKNKINSWIYENIPESRRKFFCKI